MSVGPIDIFAYEALAKEWLPQAGYDLIAGGAPDESTVCLLAVSALENVGRVFPEMLPPLPGGHKCVQLLPDCVLPY